MKLNTMGLEYEVSEIQSRIRSKWNTNGVEYEGSGMRRNGI